MTECNLFSIVMINVKTDLEIQPLQLPTALSNAVDIAVEFLPL